MAEYKNHLRVGFTTKLHRNRQLATAVGDVTYENFLKDLDANNFRSIMVVAGLEHRPDLLSNAFYGTVSFWWLILLANNIEDPFEGLNVGDKIRIPII